MTTNGKQWDTRVQVNIIIDGFKLAKFYNEMYPWSAVFSKSANLFSFSQNSVICALFLTLNLSIRKPIHPLKIAITSNLVKSLIKIIEDFQNDQFSKAAFELQVQCINMYR